MPNHVPFHLSYELWFVLSDKTETPHCYQGLELNGRSTKSRSPVILKVAEDTRWGGHRTTQKSCGWPEITRRGHLHQVLSHGYEDISLHPWLLTTHKMMTFSSLIRNEGETRGQKGFSGTRNTEKDLLELDMAVTWHSMESTVTCTSSCHLQSIAEY